MRIRKTPTFCGIGVLLSGAELPYPEKSGVHASKGQGEGMTLQRADAVLEFPDDRLPVTKAKEVTKAVTELDRARPRTIYSDCNAGAGRFL